MTLTKKAAASGLCAALMLVWNVPALAQETTQEAAALAAPAAAQVSAPERDRYLREIKRRHGTGDERTALLAESNRLLAEHAVKTSRQLNLAPNQREDLTYQLSLGAAGELLVREERRTADGVLSVRRQSISLFGSDSFVRHECQADSQRCVLFDPQSAKPWLSIERNPQGAQQLARTLGFLIRNLQKG